MTEIKITITVDNEERGFAALKTQETLSKGILPFVIEGLLAKMGFQNETRVEITDG